MERKLVWVCDPFIMETEPNLVDYPGLSLQPLLPGEGQRGSPGGAGRAHPSPLQFSSGTRAMSTTRSRLRRASH